MPNMSLGLRQGVLLGNLDTTGMVLNENSQNSKRNFSSQIFLGTALIIRLYFVSFPPQIRLSMKILSARTELVPHKNLLSYEQSMR